MSSFGQMYSSFYGDWAQSQKILICPFPPGPPLRLLRETARKEEACG